MENWHLIAGLGNPGRGYQGTRHNAGFMVVERLARRWRVDWNSEPRFRALVARGETPGGRVWLLKPLTYMNLSGEAIQACRDYYRVALAQLLVVVDDADLPLGALRLRPRGRAGGHHGLESIEQRLGTRDYARLRVGIGRSTAEAREIRDWVLGRFDPAERDLLSEALDRAAAQAECWLSEGLTPAMNRFNRCGEPN